MYIILNIIGDRKGDLIILNIGEDKFCLCPCFLWRGGIRIQVDACLDAVGIGSFHILMVSGIYAILYTSHTDNGKCHVILSDSAPVDLILVAGDVDTAGKHTLHPLTVRINIVSIHLFPASDNRVICVKIIILIIYKLPSGRGGHHTILIKGIGSAVGKSDCANSHGPV